MEFIDKITGKQIKQEFKKLDLRAKKLPKDYQKMWSAVKDDIWVYSNFTGSNLIPIMENVLWIFEESVANGENVENIVGSDVAKFCEAVADKANPYDYRNIMRKRLDDNVNKNLKRGNLV